jgi:hypothetical protein
VKTCSEFTHASDSFKRLNPHLFAVGSLDPAIHSKQTGTLDGSAQSKHGRRRCIPADVSLTINLTGYIPRRMDPDNLAGAMKPIQDVVAEWLRVDDGDPRIRWEYGQVETRGECGVVVRMESTIT